MKTRAVIFRKDRTNDVLVPTQKRNDLTTVSFRHEDNVYFLDPDRVMITMDRPWHKMWKRYYSTQYYVQGFPNPLPVPDFQHVEEVMKDENGKPVFDLETGLPIRHKVFPQIINVGVEGGMLAQIFNPYFLRIIAAMGIKTWEKIQFLLIAATLAVVVFIAYTMTQQPTASEIADAVIAAQTAAQQPPPVVVDPGA